MPEVQSDATHLSQNCINECIQKLLLITEQEPILTIQCTRFVQEVNISVIAYFILFKKRMAHIKGFQIVLHLEKNLKPYVTSKTDDRDVVEEGENNRMEERWQAVIGKEFDLRLNNSLGRTLRQYMAYAYLQTQGDNPFTVRYGYVNNPSNSLDTDNIAPLNSSKSSWFTISKRFIPIIGLEEESYDLYFRAKINDRNEFRRIYGNITGTTNSKTTYRALAEQLQVELTKSYKSNKRLSQIIMARLAFIKALDQAMILHFYLNENRAGESDLKRGISPQDSKIYFNKILPVFLELNEKPPICHFIFSTLICAEVLPEKLTKETIDEFSQAIKDLWIFVKELVYGVQELALNIIEHSDKKRGIISCRVYNFEDFASLNPEIASILNRFLLVRSQITDGNESSLHTAKSLFDFQVADDGEIGLINTLLNKTNELKEGKELSKADFEEDLKKLKNGEIKLLHLLNADQGLILNQQAKRATAHFGLLTLAKLVERNEGVLRASSWEKTANHKTRHYFVTLPGYTSEDDTNINFGTNYHIILPISNKRKFAGQFQIEDVELPEAGKTLIEGIERLFQFNMLDSKAPSSERERGTDTLLLQTSLRNLKNDEEYWNAFSLRSRSATDSKLGQPYIVALNMEGVDIDHGKLFRFLGNWELEYTGQPLIVYNFPIDAYLQLLRLNHAYVTSQNIPFWNRNALCVFYCHTREFDSSNRFYFTDALWGTNESEFISVNAAISRTAFNGLSIDLESGTSISREWLPYVELQHYPVFTTQQLSRLHRFGLFDKKGIILPANILIKNGTNSLFALNAITLLQNDIDLNAGKINTKYLTVNNYHKAIQGYKIKDSHFRIGSKIHISDFYYAKRFFQNSFFSSPVAYLIACDIIQLLLNPPKSDTAWSLPKEITLIGYGQYSEMLLSLTEHFLKKALLLKFPQESIETNFDILDDTRENHFLKNEKISNNVILINPIASTFSTSAKMQNAVFERKSDANILGPHFNILYVYDQIDDRNRMESLFGLSEQNLEDKTIKLSFLNNSAAVVPTTLKFYLYLPTKWYSVADCKLCFPESAKELNQEKPLYVTEKTPVTPTLIFGLPKGRIPHNKWKGYEINSDCVKYGHYVHNSVHYLYYIDIEKFFKINKPLIKKWLSTDVKKKFADYGQVLIMSPSHNTNTGFLNLINEEVFFNAATILHYDAESDHIQNFELFYERELSNKNTKVIFVDDIITAGSTLIKTNLFLTHTHGRENGFDAAIILMDRSDQFTHKNTSGLFAPNPDNYITFADIQLPSIKSIDTECPICLEETRYQELAKNSFLDRLKYHFLEQAAKIHENSNPLVAKKIAVSTNRPLNKEQAQQIIDEHVEDEPTRKYIRKIDVINRVFRWFGHEENRESFDAFETFEDWMWDLFTQTKDCPFVGSDLQLPTTRLPNSKLYRSSELSDTLLKVLTQSPFTSYKPVREKVFRWVLDFLITLVEESEKAKKPSKSWDEFNFRTLKFLIRRAGQLNQNYLISEPFFKLLKNVYEINQLPALIEQAARENKKAFEAVENERRQNSKIFSFALKDYKKTLSRLTNLQNFNVFFAAQVKELLFMNEARSIKLEKLLSKPQFTKRAPALFIQLTRIIREENGILLYKFYDYFEDKFPKNNRGTIDSDTGSLGVTLDSLRIEEHFRSKTIIEFFGASGRLNAKITDDHFKNYLWLMYYLKFEQTFTKTSLKDKTREIMTKLQEIVYSDKKKSGMFMMVEYEQDSEDPYFPAYNDGALGRMDEKLWRAEGANYIEQFLNGNTDNTGQSAKTIIELHRINGKWYDIFATNKNEEVVSLHPDVIPEPYDHLLLIRVNQRTLSVCLSETRILQNLDHPLAVLGFFSKTGNKNFVFNIADNRYLLVLRRSLAEFIHNHHENNEFKDWMIADQQSRTALLTGHGKEMLITLANHNFEGPEERPFKDIIATIQMIQSFIIDIEREKTLLNYVVCAFKLYFDPKTAEIDHLYFEKGVKLMIKDIFKLDEIENQEAISVPIINAAINLDFLFPKKLLDMFMFELIVNAKKNRWISRDYFENQVNVDVTDEYKSLRIIISNTGPWLPEKSKETIASLNSPYNMKKGNDASGIFLIKKILELFGLGELKFLEPDNIKGNLHMFKVELILKKWNVDSHCNNNRESI